MTVVKKMNNKSHKIKYAGARGKGVVVILPNDPRKHKCSACGKIVGEEIKITVLHHWWYAYQPKTVKEKPELVLENTSESCYYCHTQIADSIRALLYADVQRVVLVARQINGSKPKQKYLKLIKALVEDLCKNETFINEFSNKMVRMIEDEEL